MEYIYSAMVLHSAGKPITDKGIISILEAAGITVDNARVKALTSSLSGVNIADVIANAAMAPVGVAAAPAAGPSEKKEDKKKVEEEEEEEDEGVSEEEAAAGLGALFG